MAELQRLSPALWGLAETARLRGDHGAAAELRDRGHATSARVGDAAYLFPYLVTGVRAHLAASGPGDAGPWLEEVAAALATRAIPGTLVAVDHGRGLVALAEGDLAAAGAALEQAAAGWRARRRFWEGTWPCSTRPARPTVPAPAPSSPRPTGCWRRRPGTGRPSPGRR